MARLTGQQSQELLRKELKSCSSLGTFIGMPGTLSYELAALAGFNWVICDLEHGENEFSNVSSAVVGFNGPVITRVPSPSAENISRALDRGSAGVMLPKISSSIELQAALSSVDYPPQGIRGVASYNRSAGWGSDSGALINAKPVVIVQVETKWAADNALEIAEHPRIDAVFIGPLDLSFSLGMPREFENPDFLAALENAIAACKSKNMPVGILATDVKKAIGYRELGFDFIAIGSDSTSLLGAFSSQVDQLRKK
jgi:2-dehydro-3-deoxyglucarate aldolase/4-hydroxy-2-oxoheptanedioate aldolase